METFLKEIEGSMSIMRDVGGLGGAGMIVNKPFFLSISETWPKTLIRWILAIICLAESSLVAGSTVPRAEISSPVLRAFNSIVVLLPERIR